MESRNKSCARNNAKIVIRHSTIYPFKLPTNNMACIYCDEEFEDPILFRKHMRSTHSSANRGDYAHGLVKVDCTELNCRLCSKSFEDIQSIADHLKNLHKKKVDLNVGLGLVPFVLPNRQWICAVCKIMMSSLRNLSRHMSMAHFSAVTCDVCGRKFANTRSLDVHVESKHNKIIKCVKCRLIFATAKELGQHKKVSNACWQYVCPVCNERFQNHGPKEKHMQQVHKIISENLRCTVCGETFPNTKQCLEHFRIAHTDDKLCCALCPQMFLSKARLERHMVSHTKEKPFLCTICDKAFGFRSSLNQHMWMHRVDKRFKCTPCKKQFNQKVTWISHMKKCSQISEYSDG